MTSVIVSIAAGIVVQIIAIAFGYGKVVNKVDNLENNLKTDIKDVKEDVKELKVDYKDKCSLIDESAREIAAIKASCLVRHKWDGVERRNQ